MNFKVDFATKFASLGGLRALKTDEFHPFPHEELARLEKAIGSQLPVDYRTFLNEIGGAMFSVLTSVRAITPPPSAGGGLEPFTSFHGSEADAPSTIWTEVESYKNRIPAELLPIADNMFGDQYCLALRGPDAGKVYFWDHDDERCEQDYWDQNGQGKPVPRAFLWGNLYLVANSFRDFLNRLEPDPEQ